MAIKYTVVYRDAIKDLTHFDKLQDVISRSIRAFIPQSPNYSIEISVLRENETDKNTESGFDLDIITIEELTTIDNFITVGGRACGMDHITSVIDAIVDISVHSSLLSVQKISNIDEWGFSKKGIRS
jgi:hypothetical protein